MNLDTFDKKILHELDIDATLSLKELSKITGRSKQFVSYRLERMESEGLILGYSSVVDVTAIGSFCFRIYIDFQHMTRENIRNFIKEMQGYPELVQAYKIRGNFDVALYIVVEKLMQFRELWDKILGKYKDVIKEHHIFTYAPIYNFSKSFHGKTISRKIRGIGLANEQIISKEDWQILEEYSKNVRATYVQIAHKLKLSSYTVKKRIEDMRKSGVISGTNIDINPEVIGKRFYCISLTLDSLDIVKELYDFCLKQKEVYQVNRIIGGEDFEIKVMVNDKEELLNLIDEIKIKFPRKICDDKFFSFKPVYSRGIVPY